MSEEKFEKWNRPSLVKVRKTYTALNDLLGNLSNKLSDVSSNVDREFLSSYRVHMLSIQSEIKNLKREVASGEQALNNDGSVAKLESEVNWFIDECTRLKVQFKTMESDSQQMETRLNALVEQEVYLSEQLKSIMKKNKVIQAEIEYAENIKNLESLQINNNDESIQTSKSNINYSLSSNSSLSLNNNNNNKDSYNPNSVPNFKMLKNKNNNNYGKKLNLSKTDSNLLIKKNMKNLFLSNTQHFQKTKNGNNFSNNFDTSLLSPLHNKKNEFLVAIDDKQDVFSENKNILHDALKTRNESEFQLEKAIQEVFDEVKYRRIQSAKLSETASPRHSTDNFDDYIQQNNDHNQILNTQNINNFYNNNNNNINNINNNNNNMNTTNPLQNSVVQNDIQYGNEFSFDDHTSQQQQIQQQFQLQQQKQQMFDFESHSSTSPSYINNNNYNKEKEVSFRLGVEDLYPLHEIMETIKVDNPQIISSGGISGMGLKQFTDNDKYFAIVKFLMNFEQFKMVVEKLESSLQ